MLTHTIKNKQEQELQSRGKKIGTEIWDNNLGRTDRQTDRQTDGQTRPDIELLCN